jgi:hypothetical protein
VIGSGCESGAQVNESDARVNESGAGVNENGAGVNESGAGTGCATGEANETCNCPEVK